jgi:ribonuclease PH
MPASALAPQALFRPDHRHASQLRPTRITPGYVSTAEGSVLIEAGNTRVLCNATIETGVPGWMRNSGKGWVTAEYGMLPRATVDMNVVLLASGGLVETQATAEKDSYTRAELDALLDLAEQGIRELIEIQSAALAQALT